MSAPGVIELWASGGLDVVDLPSGLRIRGVRPSIQDLVVNGIAPSDLLAQALPLLSKNVATFDEQERVTWIRWQRVQAAAFIRDVWDPMIERWVPAVVTPEMLASSPPEDVDALEDIVLRRRTPGQVTALTRFTRGEISSDEMKRVVAMEAAGTVPAWSAFRPEPAGAAAGSDGADVAQPPVAPSRAERRRRGARSGSGARRSASD